MRVSHASFQSKTEVQCIHISVRNGDLRPLAVARMEQLSLALLPRLPFKSYNFDPPGVAARWTASRADGPSRESFAAEPDQQGRFARQACGIIEPPPGWIQSCSRIVDREPACDDFALPGILQTSRPRSCHRFALGRDGMGPHQRGSCAEQNPSPSREVAPALAGVDEDTGPPRADPCHTKRMLSAVLIVDR